MAMNCTDKSKWNIIIKAIFSFVVGVACLFVIFLIIVTAISSVEFHVTEASLSKFNLTSNNTLSYKFEANITLRNPNRDVQVYYRKVTAIAWYKDHEFARVNLASFDQGHMNTTVLNVVFQGKSFIKLKPKQLFKYNEETRLGIYNDLAIDLELVIRYKYGIYKSYRFYPPTVQCRRLSLSNGNTPSPPFHGRKCKTDHFFAWYILFLK
jgi:hypothetical protein